MCYPLILYTDMGFMSLDRNGETPMKKLFLGCMPFAILGFGLLAYKELATPVNEPTKMLLFGIGLIVIAQIIRRQTTKR